MLTAQQYAPPGEQLAIDGAQPISPQAVALVERMCDRIEEHGAAGRLVVRVSGAPPQSWTDRLTVGLVSKWERALRRLERLPVATVGIAQGDCGGAALDALLVTDYRVATAATRLLVPVGSGATWPGMALYRLSSKGANSAQVRRAVLFGEPIDAPEALRLHLVDELAEDLPAALAAAGRIAGAVPCAELAIRRQLMLDAQTVSFEDALGVHLAACDRLLRRTAAGIL